MGGDCGTLLHRDGIGWEETVGRCYTGMGWDGRRLWDADTQGWDRMGGDCGTLIHRDGIGWEETVGTLLHRDGIGWEETVGR